MFSGHYKDALESLYRALEIQLKIYGEIHPHVAGTYNNLASCLHSLEQNEVSIILLKKALAIQEKVYGETHPCMINGCIFLVDLLGQMNRFREQAEYREKLLRLQLYGFHSNEPWRKEHQFLRIRKL